MTELRTFGLKRLTDHRHQAVPSYLRLRMVDGAFKRGVSRLECAQRARSALFVIAVYDIRHRREPR